MKKTILLFISLNLFILGYSKHAYCVLQEAANSGVTGIVEFDQSDADSKTWVIAKVKGLEENTIHGFHIHEKNDLSNACMGAGAHYNPHGKEHGGPKDENRHIGDMGNLHPLSEIAEILYRDPMISLFGEYSIINRACVVHLKEDDLGLGGAPDSKKTGNAGGRMACGGVYEGDVPEDVLSAFSDKSDTSFVWKFFLVIGIGVLFYVLATRSKRGYVRLDESTTK